MSSPPEPASRVSLSSDSPRAKPKLAASTQATASSAGRLTEAVLMAGLAMFLFIEVAHQMLEGATRRLDSAAVSFFQSHQVPIVHELTVGLSWIAGAPGLILIVILALAYLYRNGLLRGNAVALLLAFPGGPLVVTVLKYLFHRPRPTLVFAGHVHFTGYSFPSGHSFCAMAVFGLLGYWMAHKAPPWRRAGVWTAAVVFIALVGFSRVFLGAHYPSDVVAGFAVGYPWLWGCLAVSDVLKKRSSVSDESLTEPKHY